MAGEAPLWIDTFFKGMPLLIRTELRSRAVRLARQKLGKEPSLNDEKQYVALVVIDLAAVHKISQEALAREIREGTIKI